MAVMGGMPGGHPEPSLDPDFALRQNYGVQAVRRLGGNVGLIELSFSPGLAFGDALYDRYAAAMALVRDTRALVLDLRQHMGGEPAAVAYFVSYFFEREPFVVNRIRYRNKPTEVFSTTAAPRGPRYGERRPVFVLMSKGSFSGAEEMAYDLQATKRAKVVGEVSGGGANPNQAYDLGGGFVAMIPNGAAINPVTGTNWEGVGVKPDVTTPAASALDTAHRLALEAALVQATAEPERQSIRQAIAGLQPASSDTAGGRVRRSQAVDQVHGGGRRAHLPLVDDEGVDVARLLLGLGGRGRSGRGRRAGRPRPRSSAAPPRRRAPPADSRWARRRSPAAAGRRRSRPVTSGMFGIVRVVGVADRRAALAGQRDEVRVAEAVVARLQHVAQLQPVCGRRGSRSRKPDMSAAVVFLGVGELPEQRPQLVAELGDTRVEEPLDRLLAVGQDLPVGAEPRALHRELEAVGRLGRPLAEALGLLRAVVGGVDLDRGELAA